MTKPPCPHGVFEHLWGETPRSSRELLWRTSFGSALHLLRHQRKDDVLAELARVYARDCLKRWVPEVEVVEVGAVREEEALQIRVRFRGAKDTSDYGSKSGVYLEIENQ